MEKVEALQVKPATKKVYLGVMKRILKAGFKPEQKQMKKIIGIKKFLNKFDKPSTKLDILNVILVTADDEKFKTDLKALRTILQKEKIEANVKTMNTKGESLISIDTFKEKLKGLLDSEKYINYIPNYLMYHYGVRNEDVNVIVMKPKRKKYVIDETKNYLVLFKDKVIYIRQKYKTVNKFGKQTHTITDKDFIKAVSNIEAGELFNQEQQLGNQLRKLLINKMTESDIFKMLIDDAFHKKDTIRINELSKSRGSAIATMQQNYDVNAVEQVIKEL